MGAHSRIEIGGVASPEFHFINLFHSLFCWPWGFYALWFVFFFLHHHLMGLCKRRYPILVSHLINHILHFGSMYRPFVLSKLPWGRPMRHYIGKSLISRQTSEHFNLDFRVNKPNNGGSIIHTYLNSVILHSKSLI